jgi:hypothetical protein
MVDQMGSRFYHPARVARGANTAAFSREGDENIMTALIATRPGKAVGEDAAFEIAAKLALGVGRHGLLFPVVLTERTKGLEMFLHHLVQRCLGGTSTGVEAGSAVLGRFGRHLEVRNEDREIL